MYRFFFFLVLNFQNLAYPWFSGLHFLIFCLSLKQKVEEGLLESFVIIVQNMMDRDYIKVNMSLWVIIPSFLLLHSLSLILCFCMQPILSFLSLKENLFLLPVCLVLFFFSLSLVSCSKGAYLVLEICAENMLIDDREVFSQVV